MCSSQLQPLAPYQTYFPQPDPLMHSKQQWAREAAASIRCSPLAEHLQQVCITGAGISRTAEADAIITGLPQLQALELDMRSPMTAITPCWAPAAGQQLRRLNLRSVRMSVPESFNLRLDALGISGSKQLRELHLSSCSTTNLASLAALPCLGVLGIMDDWQAQLQVAALAQLPQVHTLRTDWEVSPPDWLVLAGLPGLTQLQVWSLRPSLRSPGSSSIARLTVGGDFSFVTQSGWWQLLPSDMPEGSLTSLLPEAQQLDITAATGSTAQDVLRLLAGHSRLQSCTLRCGMAPGPWPAGLLSSISCLQELPLAAPAASAQAAPAAEASAAAAGQQAAAAALHVDSVLEDAAGCEHLQSISITMDGRLPAGSVVISRVGLAALAAGPCRSTLRQVLLACKACPLPVEGLALLQGLPALRKAQLYLAMPAAAEEGQQHQQEGETRGQQRTVQALQQRVVQQLQSAGCEVATIEEGTSSDDDEQQEGQDEPGGGGGGLPGQRAAAGPGPGGVVVVVLVMGRVRVRCLLL